MRWCPAPGVGIKFHYGDLLVAAQRNIKGFKLEHISSEEKKQFLREHFNEKKKERAVTFVQAAKLICSWSSEPREAATQITLFRNLLRSIRSKAKSDPPNDEDEIFVHEEKKVVSKALYEEFTREQIGMVAKNAKMVSAFVEENFKHAGDDCCLPDTAEVIARKEGHVQENGDNHDNSQIQSTADKSNNIMMKQGPFAKIGQPLKLVINDMERLIGCVEVPTLGNRMLTLDIIKAVRNVKSQEAWTIFQRLPEDAGNEVTHCAY